MQLQPVLYILLGFIHIVLLGLDQLQIHLFTAMYGYYFLAEMNWVDRRLGGKFITPMQLLQFLLCMIFNAIETFNIERCGSDWRVVAYMWFTYLVFFAFFWNIYTTKKTQRDVLTTSTTSTTATTNISPGSTVKKIRPKAD